MRVARGVWSICTREIGGMLKLAPRHMKGLDTSV